MVNLLYPVVILFFFLIALIICLVKFSHFQPSLDMNKQSILSSASLDSSVVIIDLLLRESHIK